MSEKQKTISKKATLKGYGLHTGMEVEVSFLPAEADTGYVFRRVDLKDKTEIPALAENVTTTDRGTTLKVNNAEVMTIEHALAALYGLQIDNVIIELNGPELPILDGSSIYYVEAIKKAGILEQEKDKEYYILKEKVIYADKEKGIEIIAYPDDKLSIDVHIDYDSKFLRNQYALLNDLSDFEKEISKCKTFVFLHELEYLYKNNLIKGGDVDNAIVIVDREISKEEIHNLANIFKKPEVDVLPEGILNNINLLYPNEPARHKLLDVIGDISLIGMPLKAKIIAKKPGHLPNTEFANILRKIIKNEKRKPQPPFYDPNKPPLFDVNEIKKRLPHRPPFLMIDKITFMDEWVVTGIKNVTMNEAFFTGHFPDEPVMPGVLQIEAMAQVGAVLLTSKVPDPENYLTYFLKIENIKFKNKVVPGDTLNIRMTLLGPVKRGIALTQGHIFVGDTMVMEGEFMAQLAKKPDSEN